VAITGAIPIRTTKVIPTIRATTTIAKIAIRAKTKITTIATTEDGVETAIPQAGTTITAATMVDGVEIPTRTPTIMEAENQITKGRISIQITTRRNMGRIIRIPIETTIIMVGEIAIMAITGEIPMAGGTIIAITKVSTTTMVAIMGG
jgi:hypothetical protein